MLIIIILWFIAFFSIKISKEFHKIWDIRMHNSISDILDKNKKEHRISVSDVNYIQPWMTFKYINFIFDLPPTYLKEKLKIENWNFPDMSIGMYARFKKLDKTTATQEVKSAVSEYLTLYPSINK